MAPSLVVTNNYTELQPVKQGSMMSVRVKDDLSEGRKKRLIGWFSLTTLSLHLMLYVYVTECEFGKSTWSCPGHGLENRGTWFDFR